MKWHEHRVGLPILFSAIVFLILVVTALIMGVVIILLTRIGGIDDIIRQGSPVRVIISLVVSVLVGTIVSWIVSRSVLKPINTVIQATNKLASGDFSARIQMSRIPEMAELSRSFNRMAEELGSTEMLRSDFVNNFSHEFKTPIVSIKGFAEILKYSDMTVEEREEYLDIVISESSRLSELATNVLNLAKVENQEILTEQVKYNVGEQIRKFVILLQTNWEAKNLEVTIDGEDFDVVGNEELLGQVWLNLLDNAIKFSPEGGCVSISMSKRETSAFFSVRNSGNPILPETQPFIFNKFYQGDTSHASPGNGLGLTLVKKIVDLHHGSVTFTSDETGTDFMITLPVIQ